MERAEHLLVLVSQVINKELPVEDLLKAFSTDKQDLINNHKDTDAQGHNLLSRLTLPLLSHEGYVLVK